MDFFSLMVSTAIIDIGVILLSLAAPFLYVGFAIIMYATYGFILDKTSGLYLSGRYVI